MFRFRSLFGRLMGLYLLIVVGTFGAMGLLLSQLLHSYFFESKQAELISQGRQVSELARPLFTGERPSARVRHDLDVAGQFMTGSGFVIDREGRAIATVGPYPWGRRSGAKSCAVNQALPELMAVMEGRVTTYMGYSPFFREPVFLAAVPVEVEGTVVGASVMHSRVLGLKATISHLRLLVFGAALAAVLLSTVLGFLLARSVTGPLARMGQVAGQMAAGNFEARVPEGSPDEVGRLAAALNSLSASLRTNLQTLSEERGKLEHIVTSMGEGVIAVDRGGHVVMANPQAEQMLGASQSDLAGHPLSGQHQRLAETFARAMREGREETLTLRGSDGGTTIQAHISPTAVEGSTVGAVAVVQDVTELQRVERMRRQFVADASHQLRSPLTAMQGYAEALLDDVAPDEGTRHRYLATIVRDAKRLNRLIEQLLDLSHIESGQAKLDLKALMIPTLLRRVIESVPRDGSQPRIELQAPDDLPAAFADEAYTEQALRNLLENAVRHTPPDGQVTVWARVEQERLVVGVADTGAGIAPEHLPRIWDRFYRAGESGKEGTGLGLAIVKSLVERQGGEVSAGSRLGVGSTFTFTLPLAGR
jgi:two-component system sensor histidine kinase ResE